MLPKISLKINSIYLLILLSPICFATPVSANTFTRYYRGFLGNDPVKVILTKGETIKYSGKIFNYRTNQENILLGQTLPPKNLSYEDRNYIFFTLNEIDGETEKQTAKIDGHFFEGLRGDEITSNFVKKKFEVMDDLFNDSVSYLLKDNYSFESVKEKKYQIKTVFPRLISSNKEVSAAFENMIKPEIEKHLNAFRLRMNQSPSEIKKIEYPAWMTINYNTIIKTNDFIILQFNIRRDFGNRANNYKESTEKFEIKFSFKTGKQLQISELFQDNFDYIQFLSDFLRPETERYIRKTEDKSLGQKLTEPRLENFKDWTVTKRGLWIKLPLPQYVSYFSPNFLLEFNENRQEVIKNNILSEFEYINKLN